EQPILLLLVILHPKYRINQFQAIAVNISYPTFGKWLSYYYYAWTDDVLSYWCYAKDATNKLELVACRIFASMHYNTTTQTMHNNAAIIQTTHNKTQNEQNNKDEDNKECDLAYITEAEFEILNEEEEADIIKNQDDYIELDDIIHLAIDENAK
ncbi:45841_t:CDS:2, partial [Gigaspora margarita]